MAAQSYWIHGLSAEHRTLGTDIKAQTNFQCQKLPIFRSHRFPWLRRQDFGNVQTDSTTGLQEMESLAIFPRASHSET